MNDPTSTVRAWPDLDAEERRPPSRQEEYVELLLLETGWQRAALETVAKRQGLTIGQLLRRLIAVHLPEREDGQRSAPAGAMAATMPPAFASEEGIQRQRTATRLVISIEESLAH
jgi:hypothetical protein